MKIYRDSTLKDEVEILDLGIVQAGDERDYTFYVMNDSLADLRDLKFTIDHPEVTILSFPKEIGAQKSSLLTIKWKASVTLKEALKTKLQVNGFELWR